VRVRIAERADLESVTRLINLAFRVEEFFIEGDRIQVASVLEIAEKGSFLLAEHGGGLAGCVSVELRGDRAYFGLLSVDPARQRSGIGRLLVEAAEDHARRAGCRFMDMRIVNLREELPAFYRRLGYRETGTEPVPNTVRAKLPCHFINMTKSLETRAASDNV